MKVMMATLSLHLSGQSVHIRNLGKGLIARGHEVVVATGDFAKGKPLGLEYFQKEGMSVVRIPVGNLEGGIASFAATSLRNGVKMRQLLNDIQPDVVHMHAVTLAPQVQIARLMSRVCRDW